MQKIISFLWNHGHFWNKKYSDLLNVKQEDLSKLTIDDHITKLAIASYQETDFNLVQLVVSHHKRSPQFDGEIGPATQQLMMLPRCPMPDFPPPIGTKFSYEDKMLQAVVENYQQWAAFGSGSWPADGCDPENKGIHSIRVKIDLSRCPQKIKSYLTEALAHVTNAYNEIGLSVRYIFDGGDAEIVKKFESLPGSVIGWNEFPRRNICNQTVNGRLDTDFQPDMKLWANLECHETGHGVALEHTRGGIMNPSILLVWPLTWKGSPSFNTLKKYFGGEPILWYLDEELFDIF